MLDGTELPTGEQDDDGNEIKTKLPPSAAVLTSAIQFLKNNNITCSPSKDNALGELEEKMAARRAKRVQAGSIDLEAAKKDAKFLAGMPLN